VSRRGKYDDGPRNPRDLQCQGKAQYRDELSAKISLGKLGRSGRLGPNDKMSIYKCQFCGFWHMGHSPTGKPWHEIWG
jgi:hypothetical protein